MRKKFPFLVLIGFAIQLALLPAIGSSSSPIAQAETILQTESDFFSTFVKSDPTNNDVCSRVKPTAGGLFFETDGELFLGQKQRRRGDGGRFWTNLYYAVHELEPKEYDFSIKPDMYGVQFGFDIIKSHGVYSTLFGSYTRSQIDVGDDIKLRNENYAVGFGKYAYLKGCHFGAQACISYDDLKAFDHQKNRGKGLQTNLFGEFGIDLILGRFAFKPFYALQYDFLYHGRIGEKGNSFSGDWNGNSFVQLFGTKLNWKPVDLLELQFRATWVHELLDNPPPFFNARFSPVQGTMTPAIYFYDGYIGRDWAWIGASLKWEMIFNVFLFLDYDLTINEYQTSHFGNLGLCLGW